MRRTEKGGIGMNVVSNPQEYAPDRMSGFRSFAQKFRYKAGGFVKSLLRLLFLIGMSFVMVYPILFMLSVAFKGIADVYDPAVIWVPKHFSTQAWKLAMDTMGFWKSLSKTLQMLVPCVLFEIASTTIVAYGFSRFKFRERNFLFYILLFTIVVPVQTYMIPQYVGFTHFSFFGLMAIPGLFGVEFPNYANTLIPMYIMAAFGMGIRSGLYIFIMRQFLKGLPVELEDAALIDGCGPFKTLMKVMLPNVIPALVTILVFSVVWYWNDYYVSASYLTKNFPLSVNLTLLNDSVEMASTQGKISSMDLWLLKDSVLSCGCILVLLPLVVMYVFAQKQFTESIERTGIVG